MAKITRYNGDLKAFAETATGTERTIFGDVAQSDDLTTNITADFLRGWGVVGVNEVPSKQDFNAALYVVSKILAYLHQVGIPEYNATQEYHIDSICTESGVAYSSLTDTNVGNAPSSSPSDWELLNITELDARFAALAGAAFTGDITTSGLLGVGDSTPEYKVDILATGVTDFGLRLKDTSTSNGQSVIVSHGQRNDANGGYRFAGKLALIGQRTDAAVASGKTLGSIFFGGNHTSGSEANIAHAASIKAVASGAFNSVSDMPTDLVFYTGQVGEPDIISGVVGAGTEVLRLNSAGDAVFAGDISAANMTSGSFTITGTGFTVNPTGTATWRLTNGVVSLYVPLISGTSNATSFTLTGLPVAIRPTVQKILGLLKVVDNSTSSWGSGYVSTGGVISLYYSGSGELSGWTNSGNKKLLTTEITYSLS